MGQSGIVLQTELKEFPLFRRGKVRDVYDLGEQLLIVSSDRISCFDVVLPTGIPGKGRVLTQLSCFWFDLIKDIVPTHFITASFDGFPKSLVPHRNILDGRSMLVKKSEPLPVECIVRGYLSGSGWKEYKKSQSICGIKLAAGLRESDKLPEVIFTPSTKATEGHDENVAFGYIEKSIGTNVAAQVRQLSIAIYQRARDYAEGRGIIIADTKFEFGLYNGKVMLIDEVLTPDSSRFWPKNSYAPGKSQPSFDKQFVRDYLESLVWDKTPPAPALPEDIIRKTNENYQQALFLLTGRK